MHVGVYGCVGGCEMPAYQEMKLLPSISVIMQL